MLLPRKPDLTKIQSFLDRQRTLPFSYEPVGATAGDPPAGFVVDHTRVELGQGLAVFAAGRAALERWEQFRLGWLEAVSFAAPIREGEVAGIVARALGLWWLNACRIVYVIDELSPRRFGFAYGTLPGHVEAGEERFLIETDEAGRVWYDILAFSRPRHVLAKIGYPYVRRMQKRFARDSAAHVQRIGRAEAGAAPRPDGGQPASQT